MRGVVGVNVLGLIFILQNHSPQKPHACVNTPENVTRWEYFSGRLTVQVSLLKDVLSIVTLWFYPIFCKMKQPKRSMYISL